MKYKCQIAVLSACLALLPFQPKAHAQAEPDYRAAINLLNIFQKQCFGKFPDFRAIREEARTNNWVVGPLGPDGKPVSWAVNEGADNFSLTITNNISSGSKVCTIWGKASEETTVGAFNGIYAARIHAKRTGAPENSWLTPNGMVIIDRARDGRTIATLTR